MKSSRARELLDKMHAGEIPLAFVPSYAAGAAPRTDPEGLTEAENKVVKEVWSTMPGHTCFMDALRRIAEGQALYPRMLAGRCSDGAQRDMGTKVHALSQHDARFGEAVCGAEPGRTSGGWVQPHGSGQITCKRCLKRLWSRRPVGRLKRS